MAKGTVTWFSNQKGYGFITPQGGGKDVFVHQTSIRMEGYRTLEQGSRVEYEVDHEIEHNRAIAINVCPIQDDFSGHVEER
jgi:CspA family cold shock protein